MSPTAFLTSGVDRGVRLWDLRQKDPLLFFETIHYDKITSIETLSSTVFATASDDGNLNVRLRSAYLLSIDLGFANGEVTETDKV